ncbi:MAG: hypothetical protein H6845_00420 [Alphaproteobacteria bacterium]|nr:MAG: hypothetical protein H6845_00420 [Alphaproteobacteria bacterium]
MHALKHGHKAVADVLVNRGANVKCADKAGKTTLDYMLACGYVNCYNVNGVNKYTSESSKVIKLLGL